MLYFEEINAVNIIINLRSAHLFLPSSNTAQGQERGKVIEGVRKNGREKTKQT
jgi:hypothetical protein